MGIVTHHHPPPPHKLCVVVVQGSRKQWAQQHNKIQIHTYLDHFRSIYEADFRYTTLFSVCNFISTWSDVSYQNNKKRPSTPIFFGQNFSNFNFLFGQQFFWTQILCSSFVVFSVRRNALCHKYFSFQSRARAESRKKWTKPPESSLFSWLIRFRYYQSRNPRKKTRDWFLICLR